MRMYIPTNQSKAAAAGYIVFQRDRRNATAAQRIARKLPEEAPPPLPQSTSEDVFR